MKKYILFVGYFVSPEDVYSEIASQFDMDEYGVAVVYDESAASTNAVMQSKIDACSSVADVAISCDMSTEETIAEGLSEIHDSIVAVTARGEAFLEEFKKVCNVLPETVLTPSNAAIDKCSDKKLMRHALEQHDRKLVPRHTVVSNDSIEELTRVAELVGFPMIIKPNGLSTSMLVTKCSTQEELQAAAGNVFSVIEERFKKYNGRGVPTVLAEEFMAGELFSVDAYIDANGVAEFCPVMEITTAVEAGKEDYYGFMQVSPADQSPPELDELLVTAQSCIDAVGLSSSSAHIELIRTSEGYKIVEIGPRTGGQRPTVYKLSHNIKHSLNDILTRMHGQTVDLGEFKQCSAYVKIYAQKEGLVESVDGLEDVEKLASFERHKYINGPGSTFLYARNGGQGVVDLIMAHKDKQQLIKDIHEADRLIDIIVT